MSDTDIVKNLDKEIADLKASITEGKSVVKRSMADENSLQVATQHLRELHSRLIELEARRKKYADG